MKLFKTVPSFFFIISIFCYAIAQEDDLRFRKSSLEYVVAVFRHGDRTPSKLWPSYPNQKETFHPYGLGQLTNRGKRTQFNLGKSLRRRYNKFLGPLLLTDDVKARSSDTPRTKESLMLVLAGLYPPKGGQVWNILLNWQPYAFNYTERNTDKEFFGASCIENLFFFKKYQKSNEFKTYERKHANVTQHLKLHAGLENPTFIDASSLYLDLISLQTMNIKLPEWSKYIYPSPLDATAIDYYNAKTFNKHALQYAGGFLMKEILSDIHNQIDKEEPNSRKISLYSGHEINVAFLLKVLGIYNNELPDLGSYILFELHKVNGTYGIKILFENYSKPTIQVKTLPNCSTICPLEQLEELIKDHLPNDQLSCTKVTFEL